VSPQEIPAIKDLLQQIVDQQRERGHSFDPAFLAAARATSTPADPAYAYAAIRSEFPDLDPEGLTDRTERFEFRSLDGMVGNYYIVFDRPGSETAAPTTQAETAGENPVCPSCSTVFNREAVVRELRTQSPEMFDLGSWS